MNTPQMYTTIVVDNPPKPSQLYKVGWNHFFDGLPLQEDATDQERRGYNAAGRACAEAATPGYAESQGW